MRWTTWPWLVYYSFPLMVLALIGSEANRELRLQNMTFSELQIASTKA